VHEWAAAVMRVPGAQQLSRPALIDHMPEMIRQIGETVRRQEELPIDTNGNGNGSSEAHGSLRFQAGFDIVGVVAEYNAIREVLYGIAEARGIPITGQSERIVNRTIDHGIAFAVKTYSEEKAAELQRRREDYLSFLVHDLKTSVAAIETAMYIVRAKYPDEAAGSAKLLDIVQRNARKLNGLISELLREQSNLESASVRLEKRGIDVWPLIEGLIRASNFRGAHCTLHTKRDDISRGGSLHALLPETHDVKPLADAANTEIVNAVPEDLAVLADACALGRVFQNLLSNALACTKNGSIHIHARRFGDHVEFSVRDTGQGIEPGRLTAIFDKLESDRLPDVRSGLGLAIVRELVEAHGGTVGVESRVGYGTTFSFTIPV